MALYRTNDEDKSEKLTPVKIEFQLRAKVIAFILPDETSDNATARVKLEIERRVNELADIRIHVK